MIKDVVKHKTDYGILALVSAIFIFFFVTNQSSSTKLFVASVIYSIFYFIWGILHHLKLHNLSRSIVLEYLLVSVLAVLIVSSLLL